MKFTFSKTPTLNLKSFSVASILHGLRRVSKYLIWCILLGTIIWLGYLWYSAVYAYDWTEEQKNQYRNEYAGETSFREERFHHTVEVLRERIRLHQTLPTVGKDIFTGIAL